nr:MAG TPA: hypothetical protein [Caudoviricetes sp.]
MYRAERLYTYKKPSIHFWRCLALAKSAYTVVQLVTILSRQLNCNTVYILLQELIVKGE